VAREGLVSKMGNVQMRLGKDATVLLGLNVSEGTNGTGSATPYLLLPQKHES